MKKLDDKWNKIYRNPSEYTYYEILKSHENLEGIIRYFKLKSVKKILDLGCGMGRNFFPLVKAGFEVYGIDSAKNGVDYILSDKKIKFFTNQVVVGKFQNLPYENNFFDAVISVQTLNHGKKADVLKGIEEVKRVLKNQGLIFVTLPGRIAKGKVRYCLVKTAKKIEPNTFVPTTGEEVGVPHHIFNKNMIKKYFKDFEQIKIEKDERDYYCVLGRKIGR